MEGIGLEVRWAGKKHLDAVVEIERRSFNTPWNESKFLHYVQQRNHIFKVCESRSGLVYGFILYRLDKGKIRIINLAVAPEIRRTGIGTFIVDHVTGKTKQDVRPLVEVLLLENNWQAQRFFSSLGFRLVSKKRADDLGYNEDLYLFRYSFLEQGKNRISQYLEET